MLLAELLRKAKRLYPAKQAIVCGNQRWTYSEFGERVNRLSSALAFLGVGKGDRVAILHRNCHRYLESYFGAAQIGAALVPMNYRLSPADWLGILKDSGSQVIIAEDVFSGQVESVTDAVSDLCRVIWSPGHRRGEEDGLGRWGYEALLAEGDPSYEPRATISREDTAQIYYTSGTTGQGKGVVLSYRNVYVHALGTIAEFKLDDRDVWLHAAPMFHLADAWATWSITWVGGTHVLVPEFREKVVLEATEKEGVTVTNLIPTMLSALVNYPQVDQYDFSSLRLLLSGGSPVSRKLVEQSMALFGCDYAQTYGMTETSPYLTVSTLKDHLRNLSEDEQMRYRSATGREFITIELKVVNEKGAEVRPDNEEVGEIIVRGDSVMEGYWGLPEMTEAVFEDGWLHTGDMAVIDDEGYVTIVDRKRDMIVTGGENVYSVEVEGVLYRHPAILEAAVIGVPHDRWGEAVKAVVVLKEGSETSEEQIIQFCKERMAHFKAPKSVDIVPFLPKTGSAKIAKAILRGQSWQDTDRRAC